MMKLLDALGGLTLAFLTLSGLALAVSSSASSYGAARGALARAEAVGTVLGSLDERAVIRPPGDASLPAGNMTCVVSSSSPAPSSFAFSFQSVRGPFRVTVTCGAASP
jgi:hypothetical protein